MRIVVNAILLALAMSQAACTAMNLAIFRTTAMHEFSAEQSCPDERMEVRALPVRPELVLEPQTTPPPAVAADPARLAVWKANSRRDLEHYADLTVCDVSGCGAHHTYFCWHEDNLSDDTRNDFCDVVNLDAPNPHLGLHRIDPAAGRSILDELQKLPAR